MKEIMKGIDVSLYQKEDYDFVAARAEGYSFAVLKGGGRLVSDSRQSYEHNKGELRQFSIS